jgi:hypothetical protein
MEEKKENNFLVVKHNSLINFKTKTSYTLNQLKLVCYLISNIKPEDKGFQLKRICIKDLGLSSIDSKNHKKLSEEFLELMKNPFSYNHIKIRHIRKREVHLSRNRNFYA